MLAYMSKTPRAPARERSARRRTFVAVRNNSGETVVVDGNARVVVDVIRALDMGDSEHVVHRVNSRSPISNGLTTVAGRKHEVSQRALVRKDKDDARGADTKLILIRIDDDGFRHCVLPISMIEGLSEGVAG